MKGHRQEGMGETMESGGHKRAEEALSAHRKLRASFDAIQENINIVDLDFNLTDVNDSLIKTFGLPDKESALGRKCFEVLKGRKDICPDCAVAEAYRTNYPAYRTSTPEDEVAAGGRSFEIFAYPIMDEYGNLSGAVVFARDITVRKRAEEALRQAYDKLEMRVKERTADLAKANEELRLEIIERKQAEKEQKKLETQLRQAQKMEAMGTLAGGIAHDFNNILWTIMGNADLAMDEVPEGSPVRRYLNRVLKAGQQAKDLVQRILTFSTRAELERRALHVGPVVKETLELLRATLPSTIEIRPDIATESGTVLANPTEIQQVLINLCTNAAQAMGDQGGVLEVSLTDVNFNLDDALPSPDMNPGPYLRLTVSDMGHGMDRSVMERIFDPYFTTEEKGKGSGLGLSVVHGIVKSLGGAITVSSKPGEGTTFHVFLPGLEKNVAEETEDFSPIPSGNERILFVDDEKDLVETGQEMLERLGYKVVVRTSGAEALKLLQAQPDKFDLVITDQTMPRMTGIQLAEELMRIRPDIPIILCTGYSETVTEQQARAMGIREFVMKPITRRDLAKALRRALDG